MRLISRKHGMLKHQLAMKSSTGASHPHPLLFTSRIHERTISLRFLGIILRILRREVSVYKFLHYKPVKPVSNHFCSGGRGVKYAVEMTVNSKEENS
jgi:hypothetical protein